MNVENVKGYLRQVLIDGRGKGDLRATAVAIWILSVPIGLKGLFSEAVSYHFGIAAFALSTILAVFSFIITCKLTLHTRVIYNAVFATLSSLIFSLGSFIFFEEAGYSRPLTIAICWLPYITAVISVLIIYHKTQKGRFSKKDSALLVIVSGAVGGGAGIGGFIATSDMELKTEQGEYAFIGILMCLLACAFAAGMINWLTLYYIKTLESKGFIIKDNSVI